MDDRRKVLRILRDHYASQGKPRNIALYTELTKLKKEPGETITDYIIQGEKAATALRNAREAISNGLIIAMILKGLPEPCKPLVVHMTQSRCSELMFTQFQSKFRSYEETERFNAQPKSDNVMKVEVSSCDML